MKKWGLIGAAAMFVLALGANFIHPACVPCLTVLVGIGVGYLAANTDKPRVNGQAVKAGALAALITAAGMFLGQMVGSVLKAAFTSDTAFAAQFTQVLDLYKQMGIDPSMFSYSMSDMQLYKWLGFIFNGCCFGIISIALMAGFGALGGVLWWQMSGKEAVAVNAPSDIYPQDPPDANDVF